jgi:hypothetical protein
MFDQWRCGRALTRGDESAATALLKRRPELAQVMVRKFPGLLARVAQSRQPELLRVLLETGIDARSDDANRALDLAVAHGGVDTARALLTAGTPPGLAILTAVAKGQASLVELLIAYHADVNATDSRGLTALDYAAKRRYAYPDDVSNRLVDIIVTAGGRSGSVLDSESRMAYWTHCQRCKRSYAVSSSELDPLSREEELICAKEGLDFAAMVKITCGHCGVASLKPKSHLEPLEPDPFAVLRCPVCHATYAIGKDSMISPAAVAKRIMKQSVLKGDALVDIVGRMPDSRDADPPFWHAVDAALADVRESVVSGQRRGWFCASCSDNGIGPFLYECANLIDKA